MLRISESRALSQLRVEFIPRSGAFRVMAETSISVPVILGSAARGRRACQAFEPVKDVLPDSLRVSLTGVFMLLLGAAYGGRGIACKSNIHLLAIALSARPGGFAVCGPLGFRVLRGVVLLSPFAALLLPLFLLCHGNSGWCGGFGELDADLHIVGRLGRDFPEPLRLLRRRRWRLPGRTFMKTMGGRWPIDGRVYAAPREWDRSASNGLDESLRESCARRSSRGGGE